MNWYVRLLWLVVISLLAACSGGGGSGSDTSSSQAATPSVKALASSVTVDASVPPAYSGQIANIISPLDAGAAGSNIMVPAAINGGGDSLVYAVDANNNILLAAVASSAAVPLSADSTALALARILVGALPSTVTPDQMNAAIRATPEYPHLVSVISQALVSGTSPTTSTAVFDSLITLMPQLSSSTVAAQALRAGLVHPAAAPVASPSVSTPVPYTLLSATGTAYQGVFVTGASLLTQGNVNIANTMSIAWAVASADTDGNPRAVHFSTTPA